MHEPPDAPGSYDIVPFSRIRRRTATHMSQSKQMSPHALTAVEVDYNNVEGVRAQQKEAFVAAEGVPLTYLPFTSRAVIGALAEYPRLNASVGNDELLVHREVHLGYAVDLGFEGLIVPVVHRTAGKSLSGLAREIADLAERARSRRLRPEEVAGGTFTLTNLGAYGTTITFPIINQPQVAILSTDGVRKRPVVVEQGGLDTIAIHPVGTLALAWDHRAVDGAYAAAFLQRVRDILQTRDWRAELTNA